jgi:hypothetical protein
LLSVRVKSEIRSNGATRFLPCGAVKPFGFGGFQTQPLANRSTDGSRVRFNLDTTLQGHDQSTARCQCQYSSNQLVFIISATHSGSTLLSMVLGSHSRVLALGETTWFDRWVVNNDRCSCTKPMRSCSLWSQVVARIVSRRGIDVQSFSGKFSVDSNNVFDRSIWSERFKRLVSIPAIRFLPGFLWRQIGRLSFFSQIFERAHNLLEVYDCSYAVSGRSILVDSSKGIRSVLNVYLERPESVKVIYLTRDGRGFANSLMKHHGYSARIAALRWWYGNLYIRWMIGRLPRGRKIHVRYEELCRDPGDTMKRLCHFMGIPFERAMYDFRLAEHHLIKGNPMRFWDEARIIEDRSWRAQMSNEAISKFEKIAGRMNRKLLSKYFQN